MRCYPTERLAPVKRQNIDVGLVVPMLATVVDVNWLPNVVRKTFSDVLRG